MQQRTYLCGLGYIFLFRIKACINLLLNLAKILCVAQNFKIYFFLFISKLNKEYQTKIYKNRFLIHMKQI